MALSHIDSDISDEKSTSKRLTAVAVQDIT